MSADLPQLANTVITAESTLEDGAIRVRFTGTADVEAKSPLDAFIKQLHATTSQLALGKVVLDVRELTFMSSACFKILVAWLAVVRDSEASQQYRIDIRSNPNKLWQRRSLAALSCFASNLVTIEH